MYLIQGVHSSPPTTPVTTKPLSPTRSIETNPVLGGEDSEFDSTYFNPYRVQSDDDDDDAPLTKRHLKAVTDKLDKLLSSSSAGPYSEVALKALFSSAVKEHDTSISNAAKAIDASNSQCQKASLAVEASTKDYKEATTKVEKLILEAQIFLDSLQEAAQKNAHRVNASVDFLKRSLEAELSQLGVAHKAIEAANEELHSKFDDRLTQLEAELANFKLRTTTKELDDLNSEREVIHSSVGDVSSILLHLLDAHDSILTISIRRHLAEKLRTALDILSRIEGVSETAVLPKQGGEKKSQEGKPEKTQPPPPPEPKSTTGPKDNVASASKGQKKKKIIDEDDEDEDDDIDNIIKGAPSKPDPKFKPSDQELREKMDRLEKEMKEKELLEKKKSMFP
uniref:Uncharacterized protein n=1 Tax=Lactuca sativa TaxID=4236 RepID=A0A9R1UNK1_LACSA|nr:hypothetical protein LSAT_V11C800390930 [Lactuca sativa]